MTDVFTPDAKNQKSSHSSSSQPALKWPTEQCSWKCGARRRGNDANVAASWLNRELLKHAIIFTLPQSTGTTAEPLRTSSLGPRPTPAHFISVCLFSNDGSGGGGRLGLCSFNFYQPSKATIKAEGPGSFVLRSPVVLASTEDAHPPLPPSLCGITPTWILVPPHIHSASPHASGASSQAIDLHGQLGT